MYLYVNYQGEECHHLQLYTCMSNMKILKNVFLFSVPGDFEGRNVTSNGIRAAQLFCQIESMTSFEPFTWLFIRPPWSINGACCKECVFVYMKNYLQDVRCSKIYLSYM